MEPNITAAWWCLGFITAEKILDCNTKEREKAASNSLVWPVAHLTQLF